MFIRGQGPGKKAEGRHPPDNFNDSSHRSHDHITDVHTRSATRSDPVPELPVPSDTVPPFPFRSDPDSAEFREDQTTDE
jgi:hypothetical protein